MARAAALVATDRGLLRSALLPTLLTFLGSATLATLAGWRSEERFARVAFASFVALSSMPPTLLWPLWTRLGKEARRALGATLGEDERPGEGYARLLVRETAKALRQGAVVALGLAPVFFLVELLPGIGHWLTLSLGAAWAWYWVVLDALEIPVELRPGKLVAGGPPWFERGLRELADRYRLLRPLHPVAAFVGWLARPWRHQAEFTERHAWESTGFGLAAVAFLAVPVLGVFFRAVAITAATALVVREESLPGRVDRELAEGREPA